MTDLWSDIKHSLHMFIKNPGFTVAAAGPRHRSQHRHLHRGQRGSAQAALLPRCGSHPPVAAYDFAGPGFNLTGDRPEQIHGIHVTEGTSASSALRCVRRTDHHEIESRSP